MTKNAFIERVIQEVSEGMSIPIVPKTARLCSIIDNSLRYFHEYDNESLEFQYQIVRMDVRQTELFKTNRQVRLPANIEAIEKLQETGSFPGGFNTNSNDPDYRKVGFNNIIASAYDSDAMVYGIISAYYHDYLRNFILRDVAFDYNPHTATLTIRGRDQWRDLVAHCWVHIPDESIFEQDKFFRYVVGKTKISFSNIFGIVDSKLIGNYKINIADIREDGKEMVDEVKKEIEDQKNAVDFFEEF